MVGGGEVPDLEEMRERETRRRKATLTEVDSTRSTAMACMCTHGDGGVSFWGMETCRWRVGRRGDKGFLITSLRR